MEMIQHFYRMFTYDDWANRETLASLQAVINPPEKAVKLMAHIYAAEILWLDRLLKQPPSVPVWPDMMLTQVAMELPELLKKWRQYLEAIQSANLIDQISYTNTKGELWSSTIMDVLNHVTTHSHYHRGQIAIEMRAAGFAPAYTDFIHAARKGLLD